MGKVGVEPRGDSHLPLWDEYPTWPLFRLPVANQKTRTHYMHGNARISSMRKEAVFVERSNKLSNQHCLCSFIGLVITRPEHDCGGPGDGDGVGGRPTSATPPLAATIGFFLLLEVRFFFLTFWASIPEFPNCFLAASTRFVRVR